MKRARATRRTARRAAPSHAVVRALVLTLAGCAPARTSPPRVYRRPERFIVRDEDRSPLELFVTRSDDPTVHDCPALESLDAQPTDPRCAHPGSFCGYYENESTPMSIQCTCGAPDGGTGYAWRCVGLLHP